MRGAREPGGDEDNRRHNDKTVIVIHPQNEAEMPNNELSPSSTSPMPATSVGAVASTRVTLKRARDRLCTRCDSVAPAASAGVVVCAPRLHLMRRLPTVFRQMKHVILLEKFKRPFFSKALCSSSQMDRLMSDATLTPLALGALEEPLAPPASDGLSCAAAGATGERAACKKLRRVHQLRRPGNANKRKQAARAAAQS